MTILQILFKRSISVIVAPIIAILAIIIGFTTSYPQVATAANLINVLVSVTATVTPIITGFAAWDALWERRHGAATVTDATSRNPASTLLLNILVGSVYTTLIFTTLLLALTMRAAAINTIPALEITNLAVATTTVILFTCIGYTLGTLIRHWIAALIAAAIPASVLAASVLARGISVFHSLNPYGNRGGNDYTIPNSTFFAGQTLFITGIQAVLIAIILYVYKYKISIAILLMLIAILSGFFGVKTIVDQKLFWGIPIDNSRKELITIISEDKKLRLNILADYKPVSQELIQQWARTQALLSKTPVAFSELTQTTNNHPSLKSISLPLRQIYLNPASQNVAIESGMETLVETHTSSCKDKKSFHTALVEMWLVGDGSDKHARLTPQDSAALTSMFHMSDKQGAEWMRQHFTEYANCEIQKIEIPDN